jgi:polysaccharide export outer membrane protein
MDLGSIGRRLRLLLLPLMAGALSACAFMAAAGPTAEEIETASAVGRDSTSDLAKHYLVVDLNDDLVRTLSTYHTVGLKTFATNKISHPQSRIGVGDVLSVTIWEAGEGGLFSSGAGKSVNLPAVAVDRTGNISLPYAGEIDVLGSTPLDVQNRIVHGLASRAIQPQAIVTIAKNESNTAVLNGEIVKPGRYPLSMKGDRLLEIIADAGGSKTPASETYVTVIRGSQRGSQLLKSVIEEQAENVWVRAGDQIYLSHKPRRYSVFGAASKPGIYPFGSSQVNLLEAVAGAGGLLDERADGTGLFVFRHEARKVVDAIAPLQKTPPGATVPVVYRVNMRNPAAYFYAKAFMLQDKDVLYVANARSVEIGKILGLINLATRSVGNAIVPYRVLDEE